MKYIVILGGKMDKKKAKEEIIYSAHQALTSLTNLESIYNLQKSVSLLNAKKHLSSVLKYTKDI